MKMIFFGFSFSLFLYRFFFFTLLFSNLFTFCSPPRIYSLFAFFSSSLDFFPQNFLLDFSPNKILFFFTRFFFKLFSLYNFPLKKFLALLFFFNGDSYLYYLIFTLLFLILSYLTTFLTFLPLSHLITLFYFFLLFIFQSYPLSLSC
jgi:hypothetical protein